MSAVLEFKRTQASRQSLTKREIETQRDWVDNIIHILIEDLTETRRVWNFQMTGEVREAVAKVLENHGVIAAGELYPAMPPEDAEAGDGGGGVEDFQRGSFKGAVNEICDHPVETIITVAAVVLIFLFIFFSPLIF